MKKNEINWGFIAVCLIIVLVGYSTDWFRVNPLANNSNNSISELSSISLSSSSSSSSSFSSGSSSSSSTSSSKSTTIISNTYELQGLEFDPYNDNWALMRWTNENLMMATIGDNGSIEQKIIIKAEVNGVDYQLIAHHWNGVDGWAKEIHVQTTPEFIEIGTLNNIDYIVKVDILKGNDHYIGYLDIVAPQQLYDQFKLKINFPPFAEPYTSLFTVQEEYYHLNNYSNALGFPYTSELVKIYSTNGELLIRLEYSNDSYHWLNGSTGEEIDINNFTLKLAVDTYTIDNQELFDRCFEYVSTGYITNDLRTTMNGQSLADAIIFSYIKNKDDQLVFENYCPDYGIEYGKLY